MDPGSGSGLSQAVRWFVTGADGQLGSALQRELRQRGRPFFGAGHALDVCYPEAVEAALGALPGGPPDVLVNAAAMTQVDRCEREPERAERVNRWGAQAMAELCRRLGLRLVHLSTDYVFDGEGDRPYREEDEAAPRSVYGQTKLAGERAVLAAHPTALVVRTSWLYGRGRNFVAAILAQAERSTEDPAPIRVVGDQRGRPTYAADLAVGLIELVERERTGLYHLANDGEATWWEVARAALDRVGQANLPIQRIQTSQLDLAAPRPRYSVLDCGKAARAGVRLRPWREALEAYLVSEDRPASAGPGVRSSREVRHG